MEEGLYFINLFMQISESALWSDISMSILDAGLLQGK